MAIYHDISSIADYLEILKTFSHYGVEGFRENVQLYFRGEPDDYGESAGTPGIGRGNWLKYNNESTLFRECERKLSSEFAKCSTTFEKLVLMQHYGIPTRVLDISFDSLQALFFALYIDPKSKKDDNRDSIVLVYEIPKNSICNWHSDKISVVSNIATYEHDDLEISGLPADIESFNKTDSIHHLLHEIRAEKPHFRDEIVKEHLESVFCAHPLLDNPRIRAQQGAFLVFGIDGNKHHLASLERNSEIRLAKIRIPQYAKAQIREELNLLGKTVDVVYLDWDGVSDYFTRFYGKKVEEYYR